MKRKEKRGEGNGCNHLTYTHTYSKIQNKESRTEGRRQKAAGTTTKTTIVIIMMMVRKCGSYALTAK